jgi:hypothetical protein
VNGVLAEMTVGIAMCEVMRRMRLEWLGGGMWMRRGDMAR